MGELFESGDALIRDLPHVRVIRHAPRDGRPCTYEKTYKPGGLPLAEHWARRENALLFDFARGGLRHTVEAAAPPPDADAANTPEGGRVFTYDAGPTLESWLRVRPLYEDGESQDHPFKRADQFLKLLRACLGALKEIHELGIVHCNLKPDNICLPCADAPDGAGAGEEPSLRIDFERLKLIDFAFAVSRERPLQHPLPLLPTAAHQSPRLKAALQADLGRGGGFAAQQLSWRSDLYSLGHWLGHIVGGGLSPAPGALGFTLLRAAHDLARRLQNYGKHRRLQDMPYDALIAEIDGWLAQLAETGGTPDRLRPGTGPAAFNPTPATPVMTPGAYLAAPRPPKMPKRPALLRWLAALGLAGAAAWWGVPALLQRAWTPGAPPPGPAADAADPAPQAGGTLQEANQLYMQENYAKALPIFQRLAKDGGAEAQCRLGFMFEQGRGVEKDEAKAAEWYREAAEQNYAPCQANLGWMHMQGKGVPQNEALAAELFRKAAEQGDPRGQSNLGWLYEQGRGGLEKNEEAAADWYGRAANQAHAAGQYNLAMLYKDGRGVPQSLTVAKNLFKQAAEQGHARAQAELERLEAEGR